jgi:NAD(P)-dependent dehydrogenase (short-subunit alcohol dehydrogenase family)
MNDRRTIVVTGASRGIGRAVALHLGGDGHRVIAACRTPAAAVDLADAGVDVVELDITSADSIARFGDHLTAVTPHIDVLVNNAGIKEVPGCSWSASAGPLADLDPTAFAAVVATNLVGAVAVTQSVLPGLMARGGVVVNVSSLLGSLQEHVGLDYAYNCSKAALNMFTAQLQHDLAGSKITAMSLNPGWIKTDMAGDEAPLDLATTSREIADLLTSIGPEHGGRFVDRFGVDVAW